MAQSSSDNVAWTQAPTEFPELHGGEAPPPSPAAYRDEDFPGCESFHLPASELEHYEGRLGIPSAMPTDRPRSARTAPPGTPRAAAAPTTGAGSRDGRTG